MKSLFSILIVLVEAALAYLWLALGYEAAGRALIFYLWAWTVLLFLIAGVAGHPKFSPPKPKKLSRLVRYFHRTATVARVLGLAAIGRPALAGLYLVSVVLVYLTLHVEKSAAEPKEGV